MRKIKSILQLRLLSNLFVLCFLLVSITEVFCQKKATIMVVSNGSNYHDRIVSIIQRHKYLGIIDQSALNALELEKERQKGEEFMNGYIVAQGKLSGAEYILKHSYSSGRNKLTGQINEETLNLALISVANNEVVGSRNVKLYKGVTSELKNAISLGGGAVVDLSADLSSMLSDQFEFLRMKIAKATVEKSDKVLEVLILGGYNRGNQNGQQYKVVEYVEEEVEGIKRKAPVVLGFLFLKSVEDDNFSIGKIYDGEKKIKKALDEKKKLFCVLNTE